MEGMQEKFGEVRVSTRASVNAPSSASIGMAMRGLRPIAEIQYLDYLCALRLMRDDLATVRYRTAGGKKRLVVTWPPSRRHLAQRIPHGRHHPLGRGMHVAFTQHDASRRDVQHASRGRARARRRVPEQLPQRTDAFQRR